MFETFQNMTNQNMQEHERILYLSNGIPGAIVVLATIKRDHHDLFGLMCDRLVQYDIRGSDIWNIFKNLCDEDIDKFLKFDFYSSSLRSIK